MQESIQYFTSTLESNQALQASALVGCKVLVNIDTVIFNGEAEIKVTVDVPTELSELSALIYSDKGDLIRNIILGQMGRGLFEFSWDGLNQKGQSISKGRYIIKVYDLSSGESTPLQIMLSANVDSVNLGLHGEEVQLNIAGLGLVPLSEVRVC